MVISVTVTINLNHTVVQVLKTQDSTMKDNKRLSITALLSIPAISFDYVLKWSNSKQRQHFSISRLCDTESNVFL